MDDTEGRSKEFQKDLLSGFMKLLFSTFDPGYTSKLNVPKVKCNKGCINVPLLPYLLSEEERATPYETNYNIFNVITRALVHHILVKRSSNGLNRFFRRL